MEILYRDHIGTEITGEIAENIRENLEKNYEKLWNKACEESKSYTEFAGLKRGKNLLYKRVIKKLIGKVLEHDSLSAPFKIIELEGKASKNITVQINGEPAEIKLYGRLDRVEIKDGIVRIIDYKTGKVIPPDRKKFSQAELNEMMFNEVKLKEYFQQMFYAYLYLSSNNDSGLTVGVYPLKKIADGVFWFEKLPVTPDKMLQFESNLNIMLNKIFDSETPFTQTPDIKNCRYCAYNSICYRD
jgi:ATP-dependent helicase/DNAse subunit B